jgi:N-ethylmaleimide reductase
MRDLFDPVRMGDLVLANRIFLAAMTRSRADARGVINASAKDYYGLRGGAGLLITEGVNVGPMSNAFDRTPRLGRSAVIVVAAAANHAFGMKQINLSMMESSRYRP